MLSIIFLLIGDPIYIGTILLYVCLIFTIYSGYDYFAKNMQVLKINVNLKLEKIEVCVILKHTESKTWLKAYKT